MSVSIEHLDFFPEDPEAIAALRKMAELDTTHEETQFQQKRKLRVKVALASIATSMALAGSGAGYLSYKDAQQHYGSTISQIPETACMTFIGLVAGGFIAVGGLELYGRKHPLRQPR